MKYSQVLFGLSALLWVGCDNDQKSGGDVYSDAHVERALCVAAGGFLNGWDVLEYYFVRVNDLSATGGSNSGANIDAVSIKKKISGQRFYATRVEEYEPVNATDISVTSSNSENILGWPTAFGEIFNPEDAAPDKNCSLDEEHFVSLGGLGGYIIVSFGDAYVESGDTITVYEIGNCNAEGVSDPVEVQVSVSIAVDGEWVTVFSATEGPAMSREVKDLPVSITGGSCINPPPQY